MCLLQYFERVRHSEETGEEEFLSMCVSVSRRKLDPEDAKAAQWSACDRPLLPFEPLEDGLIESAHECLQVDFANAYIGGGVLGMGTVQVRFHTWCVFIGGNGKCVDIIIHTVFQWMHLPFSTW